MKYFSLIALLLACFSLTAQVTDSSSQLIGVFPPPNDPVAIYAQRAESTIKIDGRLDEADWAKALPIEQFFKMEPRQSEDYLYPTSVKLLYDEDNLYVGAFCADSLGKKGVRVQDLRRDFLWGENDIFGIQLDPQNLRQYGVSFQTTPYGNQRDLQIFNDQNIDNDWNSLWSVRTQRTEEGYYAEFAIPFKSLRYNRAENADSTSWGLTFLRLARRDYEQTVFPAIPQAFSPYRMTYAAELKGLELPPPSANVRIEPYTLFQYDRIEEGSDVTNKDQFKLGGDVKWAISPRSVLDVTFNTDFAQAEVDRAVNNLERFNIFFPERRQFFLENSGIWAGAGGRAVVPFFSRRIGLDGNFNAEPARINAGARYTRRDQKKTIAGLLINQAATENSPAANFAVGRYLQNYGSENNIGVMVTHRLDEASQELGQARSQNSTLTVDGFMRPKDELTISYMVSASRDNSNDSLGVAGNFFAGYNRNDLYIGWLTDFVSSGYQSDMGFVFQRNVIQHNPGGYYVWRPKNIPWIRRYDPGMFVTYNHDADQPGNFQQANLYIFPVYLFFTDGSFLQYAIYPTWQNINFDFAPLDIQIGRDNYYYTRQQVDFFTDRSAKFSVSGSLNWGGFYNGRRRTIEGGLRYAPIPHVALNVDYEYNDLKDLGIEKEDLQTHLIISGLRLALNPRVQLSTFYQYNTFDERSRWNVRASWEYKPLSFVYLVYNDTQIDAFAQPFQEQQFVGKVTWMRQF
ncbi:MAG: DUF5916 domain-containing protein [Bacteroidota bacterium]